MFRSILDQHIVRLQIHLLGSWLLDHSRLILNFATGYIEGFESQDIPRLALSETTKHCLKLYQSMPRLGTFLGVQELSNRDALVLATVLKCIQNHSEIDGFLNSNLSLIRTNHLRIPLPRSEAVVASQRRLDV